MTDRRWQDRIVGERLAVDREFVDRVDASRFTRSQWDLLMTAVEFRIDRGGEAAELVAGTDRLELVLPELDRIDRRQPALGGGAERRGPIARVFGWVHDVVGGSGGVDAGARAEAVRLADEYAEALQRRLIATERWERIVAEADDHPSPE